MRQTVTVTAVSGGLVTVSYRRPTACHGDCDRCAGGCGETAAKERITVQAENTIGAAVGDHVVIETKTQMVFSAILLVYALPVVLFFLGYFLLAGRGLGTLGGVLGFLLGVAAAVLLSRGRLGKAIRFQIVSFARDP